MLYLFFFFNDTATTEIYTLSLHDALPICVRRRERDRRAGGQAREGVHRATRWPNGRACPARGRDAWRRTRDRKSTRLNSSHGYISYAVFCLKKKNKTSYQQIPPQTIQITS